MRLVRPHIPIGVRLEVIARQLQEAGKLYEVLTVVALTMGPSARLAYLLKCKFGEEKVHLDHDPPLCLREIVEEGVYRPAANDPEFLVYRTEQDHRIKTFVRGDGAQFSDAAKRRRKIKSERQDRPRSNWPKGRKLRSRPW